MEKKRPLELMDIKLPDCIKLCEAPKAFGKGCCKMLCEDKVKKYKETHQK